MKKQGGVKTRATSERSERAVLEIRSLRKYKSRPIIVRRRNGLMYIISGRLETVPRLFSALLGHSIHFIFMKFLCTLSDGYTRS